MLVKMREMAPEEDEGEQLLEKEDVGEEVWSSEFSTENIDDF
jgi:hypothetical protein